MRVIDFLWYALVLWLVRTFYFRLTGGFKVVGKENVPRKGPLIISPNHISHLDPPATACAMPRHITFMAKAELFDHKFFGALIRSLGSFPVKRGEGDMEAIRTALKILQEGKAMLMFPEGTRGEGERLLPFSRGVAMIAKRSGAPVLPVGISGTHLKWPKGGKKPKRGRTTLHIGKPLLYSEFENGAKESDVREAFSAELERRILELCHAGGYPVQPSPRDLEPKTSAPA